MRDNVLMRLFVLVSLLSVVPLCLSGCTQLKAYYRPPVCQPGLDEPGFVAARDGRLFLDGRRFRFVGVNVYSLASFPPGSCKYFCGLAHSDARVEEIMREVAAMGGNVIRIDAYQSFTEGGTDF